MEYNSVTDDKDKISVKITDIYMVAQAMELAIERAVFSEEEINQFYGPWSTVLRFCEDVKRKTKVEEVYKKKKETEQNSDSNKEQLESIKE